jgi:hypothetical protein
MEASDMSTPGRPAEIANRMILWALHLDGNIGNARALNTNATAELKQRIAERCPDGVALPDSVRIKSAMQHLKRTNKIEVLSKGQRTYSIKLNSALEELGENPFDAEIVDPDYVLELASKLSVVDRAELVRELMATVVDDLSDIKAAVVL